MSIAGERRSRDAQEPVLLEKARTLARKDITSAERNFWTSVNVLGNDVRGSSIGLTFVSGQ